jgi:hypothetical protein
MSHDAKPCDTLSAEDFKAHALWGFDASMENIEGADETWVRPFEFRSVPKSSDVLFTAAQVWAGSQPQRAGALSFRFVQSKPSVDACVAFPIYFPIRYEAGIALGGRQFAVTGKIELPAHLKA